MASFASEAMQEKHREPTFIKRNPIFSCKLALALVLRNILKENQGNPRVLFKGLSERDF